jgi:tetratricopeptide (TPR) repeat protein
MENARLGYAPGFTNACSEAFLNKDWNQIQEWSEECLKRNPDDATALAWKGEALVQIGQLGEAETLLRASVAKQATSSFGWNKLGHCLIEKQAWVEAYEALSKSLALESNQLDALQNRGKALFEIKHYKESVEDFRAALALRPEDPILKENLRQAERYASASELGSKKKR